MNRTQYRALCMSSKSGDCEDSRRFKDAIAIYTYYCAPEDKVVLILDNGRFVNHSDTPTSRFSGYASTTERDVEAGEELTENYARYDAFPWPETWDDFSEASPSAEMVAARKRYAETTRGEILPPVCSSTGTLKVIVRSIAVGQCGLFLDQDDLAEGTIWRHDSPNYRLSISRASWEVFVQSQIKGSAATEAIFESFLRFAVYDPAMDALVLALDNIRFTNRFVSAEGDCNFPVNAIGDAHGTRIKTRLRRGEQLVRCQFSVHRLRTLSWPEFVQEYHQFMRARRSSSRSA